MNKLLVAAGVLILTVMQSGYAQASLGLQVKDGCFYREGKPCRGVGANYFELFRRVLSNPTNTTSLTGLEQLSKAGIPFVRFAGPFHAQEWRLYLDDSEEYFRRFDLVVRAAEKSGIGLKGVAVEAGRPVFVGEFGLAVKKDEGDVRAVFEALLKEMEVATTAPMPYVLTELFFQNNHCVFQ